VNFMGILVSQISDDMIEGKWIGTCELDKFTFIAQTKLE